MCLTICTRSTSWHARSHATTERSPWPRYAIQLPNARPPVREVFRDVHERVRTGEVPDDSERLREPRIVGDWFHAGERGRDSRRQRTR